MLQHIGSLILKLGCLVYVAMGRYVVPDPNFVFDMPMHCFSSLHVWVVAVLKLDVSCNWISPQLLCLNLEFMSNNSRLDVMQISSASNCIDYQSRRFSIRYRPVAPGVATTQQPPKSKKMKTTLPPLQFVHTLNAIACAVLRMIIAILENNQQEDAFVCKLRWPICRSYLMD